jgi:hypothetical protein
MDRDPEMEFSVSAACAALLLVSQAAQAQNDLKFRSSAVQSSRPAKDASSESISHSAPRLKLRMTSARVEPRTSSLPALLLPKQFDPPPVPDADEPPAPPSDSAVAVQFQPPPLPVEDAPAALVPPLNVLPIKVDPARSALPAAAPHALPVEHGRSIMLEPTDEPAWGQLAYGNDSCVYDCPSQSWNPWEGYCQEKHLGHSHLHLEWTGAFAPACLHGSCQTG